MKTEYERFRTVAAVFGFSGLAGLATAAFLVDFVLGIVVLSSVLLALGYCANECSKDAEKEKTNDPHRP